MNFHGSLGNISSLQAKLDMLNIPAGPLDYALLVFAGDNGVSLERASSYEPLSSWIIARSHLVGQSFTARLMRRLNHEEWVIDVGLSQDLQFESRRFISDLKVVRGTGNILSGPALNREQVIKSLRAGEAAVETLIRQGKRALGLGEIGVGNTLSAYALAGALLELPPSEVVGWGSDAIGELYPERLDLVTRIGRRIKELPRDVLSLLEEVGSSEIIAMAGAVLYACRQNIPVMLDGFVSAVAALVAARMDERCVRVLMAPTLTREKGHIKVLDELGLLPLFNLNLSYGEGLAAGLGLFLLELANDFRFRQDLNHEREN
ncbi:MAG: nicotinate-nucleotide--dimethylbenzimidazole phosphoribosyltransferase [Bacillota bacterium]